MSTPAATARSLGLQPFRQKPAICGCASAPNETTKHMSTAISPLHLSSLRARLCVPALVLATSLLACGDGGNNAETEDDAGGGDQSDDGETGDEDERAYVVVNRVINPEGRAMFTSLLRELEGGELDIGTAIEQSGFSRTRAFGGKLYTFDGESGVVTRLRVDDDLQPAPDSLDDGQPAQLSFAGLGITNFNAIQVFVDEQRAFFFDTLGEDLVVEWNPATMTITASSPGGFLREGLSAGLGRPVTVTEDFITLPISWTNNLTFEFEPVTALAIVDLDSPGNPTIIEDDRCFGASSSFWHDGYVYVVADNLGGIAATLGVDTPPPCLLRWQPGADSFDPDFYVDLAARTGYELIARGISRGDGTFVTQVYSSDVDPSTLSPIELIEGRYWQHALVDIDSDESRVISELEPASNSPVAWVIDGDYLITRTDDSIPAAVLYRLGEQGQPTELVDATGDIFWVDRLW